MIIIGLGNPGKKYEHTRHNVGFMVLDAYASAYELHFNERKIEKSLVAFGTAVVLAKPQTFMNDSGEAARQILRNNAGTLVVVHDDIDIPLGEVKCSQKRGSGDHNGVQSIIDHLGTNDFFRVRVGVRPIHEELLPRIAPPDGFERFLLDDFTVQEEEKLKEGIEKAVKILELLKTKSPQEVMNEYN